MVARDIPRPCRNHCVPLTSHTPELRQRQIPPPSVSFWKYAYGKYGEAYQIVWLALHRQHGRTENIFLVSKHTVREQWDTEAN